MLPALLLIAAAHGSLQFIDDDYPKALATARAAHKPLFVDFWATWCHSCLSMQRYVMGDPGMKPVADEVVWASVETETEKNKPVVEQYPLDVWPTFLIVDPDSEKVLGRWLGSASVRDLRGFVQEGVKTYRGKGKKADAADGAQREGDAARIKGDLKASAEAYARALAASKPDDPQRPERLALLANALRKLRDPEAARRCVQLGLAELKNTGDSSVATDFIGYASACAEQLPQGDPDAAKLLSAGIDRLREVVAKKDAPLAADDRSDALANLSEMLDESHRHPEAVQAMQERAQVLEKAAAAAPDATMASTFDAHRTDTWLYLGEPQKAEALLARREKEMPDDYNPPARLARVLFEEKKLPDAEAAVDRALEKMPKSQRRIGILGLKAKILKAEGKNTSAVLREQLDVFHALPTPQRNPDQEKKLEEQLKTASR
jgi:tetratricopeptide (TPR) repeat protein